MSGIQFRKSSNAHNEKAQITFSSPTNQPCRQTLKLSYLFNNFYPSQINSLKGVKTISATFKTK